MEIAGKVALVLGGGRGIGKAIGLELAKEGATVILTYFDWPEESAAMCDELSSLGEEHMAVQVDLRVPQEIEKLIEDIDRRHGRLDILINNIERGGMPVVHGSYDLPHNRDQWNLEIDTTLKAKWLAFHNALPLLKKAEEGVVVTLSSIAGITGRSGPAAMIFSDGYAAANRAVSSFTETWAREGAPSVRVNELMLGIFPTRHGEGTRGWEELSSDQQQAIFDHILLKRAGKIAEIIKTILFMIQDATYMTGSVVRLDGGYVLGASGVLAMPDGSLNKEEKN
jgi:3-oxoacyl-[acyl-carrier protein] reductase